jgi:hypothetical protein
MIELAHRWEEIKHNKYRITFVSVLTGLFALGFINNFVKTAVERYEYASAAKLVEAKVLSFSSSKSGKRSYKTKAQIQYHTEDGKVIQASVTYDGDRFIDVVGQTIRIYYFPENPGQPETEEELLDERSQWLFFGTLGLISLFLSYLASKGAFVVITRPTNKEKTEQ